MGGTLSRSPHASLSRSIGAHALLYLTACQIEGTDSRGSQGCEKKSRERRRLEDSREVRKKRFTPATAATASSVGRGYAEAEEPLSGTRGGSAGKANLARRTIAQARFLCACREPSIYSDRRDWPAAVCCGFRGIGRESRRCIVTKRASFPTGERKHQRRGQAQYACPSKLIVSRFDKRRQLNSRTTSGSQDTRRTSSVGVHC